MIVHIGREIAKIQKVRGIKNEEFALKISTSVRNLNNIKVKNDLTISQLWKICEVLNFNFFALFEPVVVEPGFLKEPAKRYNQSKNHTVKFEVQYPTELSSELGKFMMHVDAVAEKMGFQVV